LALLSSGALWLGSNPALTAAWRLQHRAQTLVSVTIPSHIPRWPWQVSTGSPDPVYAGFAGISACIWAGVYELGRTQQKGYRVSREEQAQMDAEWADFIAFAKVLPGLSLAVRRAGAC
jgi:hypothetical protein